MSAEQFLKRMEATGLLDASLLAKLWKQVATSSGKISAEAIAARLVKGGHLTKAQAKKLLGDVAGGAAKSARKPSSKPSGKPQPKAKPAKDEELGLAPLDDDEEEAYLGLAPQDDDEPEPEDEGLTLVMDDEPEEDGGLEPIAGGLEPIDGGLEPVGGGLEPIDGGLEPVGGGLEPIDSGLEPVGGGLEPVDAGGALEPVSEPAGLEPIDSGLEPIDHGTPQTAPDKLQAAGGRPQRKKNPWDSTLLYVGGGGLVLLLIIGVVVFFLINRQSGAEMYQAADEDYRSQSYGQAVVKFEKFLAKFPEDPNASLARVKIGTAQLWQKVQNRDKLPALKAAKEILPKLENEPAFSEVRAELASILPQIAAGFAEPAKAQGDIKEAQRLVDLAEETMELVNTPNYIPTSIRRSVQTSIDTIVEDIALAKRNINRTKRLETALAEIRDAAAGGDTVAAFETRHALLKDYPELEANAQLRSVVAVVTESERNQCKVIDETLDALTDDYPVAADFTVALASLQQDADSGVSENRFVCFLARGSLYGLQAKTGHLLWRRFVGYETLLHPQRVTPQAGSDLIAADLLRGEVLRLKAETGEVVWRSPIGEPFADPILTAKQIFIATLSGKLFELDTETGVSARRVTLPQPLSVGPGVGKNQILYQVGEHSNIYALDSTTLKCREVYYLGHRAGTVVTPPVVALGYVFVAENNGQDYSDLHILATDANGLTLKPAMKPIRLSGRVVVRPIQTGSRGIVVTDLGAVRMFEVNTSNPKQPVTDAVDPLVASFNSPRISYPVFDAGRLWIGNTRFSRYDIQTSRNRMVCPWIQNERDTFVAPPIVMGNVVFHLRRRDNSPGYTAAAVDGDTGKAIWEIDLAVPAGLVAVDMDKKQIHVVNSQAELFEITTEDFQAGRVDRPTLTALGTSRGVPFTDSIRLDGGRWALSSPMARHKVVVYDPGASTPSGRLQARTLNSVGQASVTSVPVAFQGGLLVPLDSGQVLLVDPNSGDDQILPFQPRVEANRKVQWRRPAVLGDAGDQFVIADDRQKVYRVGVKDQPEPHLEVMAETELQANIESDLAVAGETVYGVVRGASADTLVSFAAGDLAAGKEWPLDGRVVWGPMAVSGVVLLATDGNQLLCYTTGEQQKWTSELKYGPLAGRPLDQEGDLVLTSGDGALWKISAEDGKETALTELGEPLGWSAVPFAGRLLLSASDGTLLVVPEL